MTPIDPTAPRVDPRLFSLEWHARLKSMDDALVVIVLHAYIDELLAEILRKRLLIPHEDLKGAHRLRAEDRERLAVWTGLFDESLIAEIQWIRNLRNTECAHGRPDLFSFSNAQIATRIMSSRLFLILDPNFRATSLTTAPRDQFILLCVLIISTFEMLSNATDQIRQIRPVHPVIGGFFLLIPEDRRPNLKAENGSLLLDPTQWDFFDDNQVNTRQHS